jgi:hypothetical protein
MLLSAIAFFELGDRVSQPILGKLVLVFGMPESHNRKPESFKVKRYQSSPINDIIDII